MALIKILLTYLSFMASTDVIAVSASRSTSRYTGGNGSSCHNWHCRSHVKEEDVPYDLLDNTHTARSRSRRTHINSMPTNHPSETDSDTATDTLSDMELKDDIECYLASRSKCRTSHDDANTNTETNTETEASTFWTPLPTKHPLHDHHHHRRLRDDEQASRNDIKLYNHQETLQYKYKYRQGYNMMMSHDHPTTTTRMNPSNVLSLRGGGAGSYLPAGWHPFGYGITDVGIRFLEFDGSLESDVGRFLASLKSGRKKRSILKEQWVEIVRVSKSGQSMRILRTLDHLIEFCLEAGLIR